MTHRLSTEVNRLLEDGMATGRYASKDELLKQALLNLLSDEEDLAAIREAIDDMNNGDDGTALDEVIERIQKLA